MVKKHHNLGDLQWTLSGWTPYVWRQQRSIESSVSLNAELPGIPARVPGSVQGALLEAGVVPDWNAGLNSRKWEWIENRPWAHTATLTDEWIDPANDVLPLPIGLAYSG